MGIPRYPKDLPTEWQKLQRDMKNVFTSANVRRAFSQLSTSALDVLGALNILPGGSLNAKYTNGNSALYFGSTPDGEAVILRRGDGSEVLRLEGFEDETTNTFKIMDDQGNIILADDDTLGLAQPYIPMTFVNSLTLPSNAGASFVTVQRCWMKKQHPRITYTFQYNIAGTTGEVRVQTSTGTVLSTSSLGTGSGTVTISPVDLPGAYQENITLEVQCRVTAGAGGTGAAILGCYGVESG